MSLRFKDIRNLIARNCRVSICMSKDFSYENYLLISDIPDNRYDDLHIYGIGLIETEFSFDVYADPRKTDVRIDRHNIDFQPAIEIVLDDHPRSFGNRNDESRITCRDIRPYLDRTRSIEIMHKDDWNGNEYESIRDVTDTYDSDVVYGIGMKTTAEKSTFKGFNHKLVIVLDKVV